jgi:hypothetical protein
MAPTAPRLKIKIEQDPEKPVEKSILAQEILKISRAVQSLQASGLNRKAIVVLLAHSTHFGHGDVKIFLEALADLERDYCR